MLGFRTDYDEERCDTIGLLAMALVEDEMNFQHSSKAFNGSQDQCENE